MAWVANLPPSRLVTALVIFALASAKGGTHINGRRSARGGRAAAGREGGGASVRAGMRA